MWRVRTPRSVTGQLRGHLHLQGRQKLSAWQMTSKIHTAACRFQSKHASHVASWESGVHQQQTNAKKNDRKCSVNFAFSRDAARKPINMSLKLFFESSPQIEPLLYLSLRMNVQLLLSQKQSEGLCFWIMGKFYSLFQSLVKMDNSSWLWSAVEKQIHILKDFHTYLHLCLRDPSPPPPNEVESHRAGTLVPNPGSTTSGLCGPGPTINF